MILCLKSIPAATTARLISTREFIADTVNPCALRIFAKSNPQPASSSGCQGDTLSPQCLHLPHIRIYPIIGMSSAGLSSALHFGQYDLGIIGDSPRGIRWIHTPKKLPTAVPIMKPVNFNTMPVILTFPRFQQYSYKTHVLGFPLSTMSAPLCASGPSPQPESTIRY